MIALATQENLAQTWRFGIFEVDARNLELRRNGVPVRIREQPFRILVYLLEHPGELVSREELRRVLWPSDTFVDFGHSLNTAMMKLRDALGDNVDAPVYIETVPKRGIALLRRYPGPESLLSKRLLKQQMSNALMLPKELRLLGSSRFRKRSPGRACCAWPWPAPSR